MHAYNNTKKLYKTNAASCFNKTWRNRELTPNYINIKINSNNRKCKNTIRAAVPFKLKQEIKFSYIKKTET